MAKYERWHQGFKAKPRLDCDEIAQKTKCFLENEREISSGITRLI